MALLDIRNVTRRFGDFVAVDDVSFSVNAGEFFTLLGPSGCGKTTLLRMIAGFDQPDAGDIVLDGVDLKATPPEKRPIHTVFQSYALFPHMTVAQNVAFPLRMAGKDRSEIHAKVNDALTQVKLTEKAGQFPHALSGGQKQRVALARGLVNRPRLLLLDEPLAALDAKLREQLQIELINLQKEVGITFVYVTHDQTEALALSHRIAVMNHGHIEQLDEPSRLYSFPATRFVADFIGHCNLFDGKVAAAESSAGGALIDLDVQGLGRIRARAPDGVVAGSAGSLAVRPEKIRISATLAQAADENHCAGRVRDFLYMGDVTVYIVETQGGHQVEALLANSAAGRTQFFEVGDAVEAAWRFDAGHFIPG
ncbi:MAG: ABC transporter ATP-binding protein [Pseudomonadota bacterium]|nr:ABC transporter ATP-binding protein [Pseudomonadota bacterium]